MPVILQQVPLHIGKNGWHEYDVVSSPGARGRIRLSIIEYIGMKSLCSVRPVSDHLCSGANDRN